MISMHPTSHVGVSKISACRTHESGSTRWQSPRIAIHPTRSQNQFGIGQTEAKTASTCWLTASWLLGTVAVGDLHMSHARPSKRTNLNQFKSRNQARLIFPFGKIIKYDSQPHWIDRLSIHLWYNGDHRLGRLLVVWLEDLIISESSGQMWALVRASAKDGAVAVLDRNTRLISYS